MQSRYVRAMATGAVFSLPVIAFVWLAAVLRQRAVHNALSKGHGVLCVGLDIYLLFLLLITAVFAVAGIMSVRLAMKTLNHSGEAGKVGGVAGAVAVVAAFIIIVVIEAYHQVIVARNFSWPASLAANAYAIIVLLLYCLVPALAGASISAFSGILYYRLQRRSGRESR